MRRDAGIGSRELQTDREKTSLVTGRKAASYNSVLRAIFQGPEGSGGRASRHVHLSVIYEVWQWKELWDHWEKVK